MSQEPHFLSEFATASLKIGLSIRLRTMTGPDRPGPELEFLVSPEQATEFAHGILEAVADWKQQRRH